MLTTKKIFGIIKIVIKDIRRIIAMSEIEKNEKEPIFME